MFDQYCLGVDVSSWQSTVHWEKLHANGVRFAIIKAAQGSYRQDPLCPAHLKAAQATGMICGVYHWMDPGCTVDAQISNLKHRLNRQEYSFLALDVEQYWSDWGEWQQGMISKRYTGKQISDCARACAESQAGAHLYPRQFCKRVCPTDAGLAAGLAVVAGALPLSTG